MEQKIQSTAVVDSELVPTIDDEDDMMALDEVLLDEDRRRKIIQQISRIGGSDYKDAVKLAMKRILTKSFMCSCNLKGTGGKKAFEKTKLYTILIESITRKYGVVEENVRCEIAKKFKNAPFLNGGPGALRRNEMGGIQRLPPLPLQRRPPPRQLQQQPEHYQPPHQPEQPQPAELA